MSRAARHAPSGLARARLNGLRSSLLSVLGEDEQPIEEIRQRQNECAIEWGLIAQLSERSAKRGADHEADAECGADSPEIARPVLGPRDVRNCGLRRAEAAAEKPGQHARRDDQRQGGRHGKQEVVERKPADRDQQHHAPPQRIGHVAEQWRRDESRDRHAHAHPRRDVERLRQRDVPDAHQQTRQHRHDEAETHRIEEDRHQYEDLCMAFTCGKPVGEVGGHWARHGSGSGRRTSLSARGAERAPVFWQD